MTNKVFFLFRTPIALIILLIIAFGLRTSLLLTSQAACDGDEALVGIMAKHILEKGEHPLYAYGQDYSGGASIEAHLGAISYALFGMSSVSFKAVGLIISLSLLLATYFFVRRYYGVDTSFIVALLLAFSPTFVEWNLKVRGGYMLTMIFNLGLCHLFFKCIEDHEKNKSNQTNKTSAKMFYPLGFGLMAGLAYWNLPVSALFIITLLFLWACHDYGVFLQKRFLIFCAGVLIGLIPIIAHTTILKIDLWGFIASKRVTEFDFSPAHILQSFWWFLKHDGPSFFTPHLDHPASIYYNQIPPYAWFLFSIAITAFAYLVINKCIKRKSLLYASPETTVQRVIPFYIFIYIIIYLCESKVKGNPRYLLPLEPFLTLVTALFYVELLKHSKWILRGVGLLVLAGHILIGIGVNALWLQKPAQFASAGSVSTVFYQKTILKTIHFLDQQNIQYVYTPDHLLEWKIIFESKERIIASRLDPSHRYLPYIVEINRAVVDKGSLYAIVFPKTEDKYSMSVLKKVVTFLNTRNYDYKIKNIDNIIIFHGIPSPIFDVIPEFSTL